jgi:nucleoside-diphosphate-sugar epimerase
MRILVTGAGGFVGKALVPHLVQEGHEVIAATRNPSALSAGQPFHVETVGPETDWRQALVGVDAVVHLAARAHVLKESAADPLGEHRRVNTEGTRRLAHQALEAGVKIFIFMSSIGVLGNNSLRAKNGRAFTEEDKPNPHDDYSKSKWDAEQALSEIVGMEKVIIRPCLIYGPGVPGNFRRLIGLARKGRPFPLGSVSNKRSLLGVTNLCSFISRCVSDERAIGNTFVLADDEALSTAELYENLCRLQNVQPKVLNVPEPILRALLSILGKGKMAERLCDTLIVDSAKAHRHLDWSQPVGQSEGLEDTVVEVIKSS